MPTLDSESTRRDCTGMLRALQRDFGADAIDDAGAVEFLGAGQEHGELVTTEASIDEQVEKC